MPFDYAPAPESRSIVDIESNYGLFIGGSFTDPTSGEFFKTINPATEEVLSEVAEAGQADGGETLEQEAGGVCGAPGAGGGSGLGKELGPAASRSALHGAPGPGAPG